MFSTPKAYVKIDFNCPHAGNSPEAEVLTDIFTRLLMDYLNEYGKKMKFITSLEPKGSSDSCLFV
jgi:secreted Zn-dependent insulinase-like peptidase